MPSSSMTNYSGSWKRNHVGEGYDEFWKLQGHSWMKRKIAAKAHLTRVIEQEGFQVSRDEQVFAGLLSVNSSYPIYESKKEAEKARDSGNVVMEEAQGKRAFLVAWYDEQTEELCLHRTFENEPYIAIYKHKLLDEDTLQIKLEAIKGNTVAATTTTYKRH